MCSTIVHDFLNLLQQFVSAFARLSACVSKTGCSCFRRKLYMPMLLLLIMLLFLFLFLFLFLHLEGEDAPTIPTDGGGGVFGGAAMTRRRRLRYNKIFSIHRWIGQ